SGTAKSPVVAGVSVGKGRLVLIGTSVDAKDKLLDTVVSGYILGEAHAGVPPAIGSSPARTTGRVVDIGRIDGIWVNTRMSERYILKDDHTGGIMAPSGEIWTKFNWTF